MEWGVSRVLARAMPNQICRKQMSGVYVTSATAHETHERHDAERCAEGREESRAK